MNKSELIKESAMKTKMSQKDCQNCLNALTEIIASSLRCGDKISLVGFGSFSVKTRNPRRIINPQTKKPMLTSQKFVPSFKAFKSLEQSIR
ncbi:MAG: HU family DNA-binding protein [Clostridia bacterium]